MRALGPRLALLSGLLDMLKGTAAVLLARFVGAGIEVEVLPAWPRSSATAGLPSWGSPAAGRLGGFGARS